jgi:TonB-linked SusC/RagA family outer membrane protein
MKNYLILFLVILQGSFLGTVYAQTGFNAKVIDMESQAPLPQATIQVNGQNKSAVSDVNGLFSFILPSGKYQLNIKYLGYHTLDTLIELPTKNILLFPLKRITNQLAEVVISTGYQNLPRERATGSFTHVDNNTLSLQIGTNIINRLEGITSAISVDNKTAAGTMMVRGLSTIRGPREPLIILDNFPYEGSLDNINPNDIESVTVLKDAAAASIWGARAGNGVIVLTSKKAKYGQPLKINANASMNVVQSPDLYYQQQMSPGEFVEVEQFLFSKGYYTSQENATTRQALTPVVEIMIAARDGKITSAQRDAQLNQLKSQDLRKQLDQYIYQNAINQQYNLDIQGGDKQAAYIIGVGYDQNKNDLDAAYRRLTLKVDHQLKITEKLTLNTRFNYNQSFTGSGKSNLNNDKLPLYTNIADEEGNPLSVIKDYRQSYTSTLGNGQLFSWDYYPLTDYQANLNTTKLQEILINGLLSYKIIKGLQLDLRYQYQRQNTTGKLVQGLDSYYTRRTINLYTTFDGGVMKRNVPLGEILNNSGNLLIVNNARAQLNYNLDIAKHQLVVLAGAEAKNSNSFSSNNTVYGYNDELLTSQNVDFANTYPTIINGSRAFIPNSQSSNSSLYRFVSLFSNTAYTYDNKYTISLSGRKDASNLFGVKANDRWNILWSSGASWLISGEDFYKVSMLPYLKLRASYGASGNIDPAMSAITTLTYSSTSPYTQLPFINFSTFANPELRWEKVKMFNIGLDFSSNIHGLSGSVEYYQKSAKDLFGQEIVDYTTGIGSSIVKNTASMKAWGMDIELKASMDLGRFKWTPNLFVNLYRDKVTDYYLSTQTGSTYVNGDRVVSGIVGKPVYSMLSYNWAGLDAVGDPQGIFNGVVSKNYANLTGSTTKISDLVYSGPLYAPFSGGFGNTFQYQNFSVSIQLNFKAGNYFRRETISYSSLFSSRTGHADYAKRWQKSGDELVTDVPALAYPVVAGRDPFYGASVATIEKGDLIRLKYINLSYTFNRQTIKQLPFKQVQLFAVANNLGLLWTANNNGLDPDYSSIPASKSIAFGIRTQF